MRILLIDPSGAQRYVTHNAGLAYLSSALMARGHGVRVLDMNNYSYTNDEVAEYALTFKPDWVGASVKTALVSSAERTMRAIREVWPHARTIAGGAHIGVAATAYMSKQDVYEFGLTGEGERAFPDLIEGKDPKQIPSLIYYDDGAWRQNKTEFTFDLDNLPYPTYVTWDRIDRTLFPYLMVHSRGCPYSCTFCSVPKINGRRFRKRSPEGTVEELRYARKEYVFRDFEFLDDNLTLDVEHAKRVCEALIKADLGVGWYANNGVRADRLDKELTHLMKRSGCKGVAIGVESANDDVLKNIKKGETVDELRQGILLLKEAGITVGGHFIVGLPGDTLEKVQKSIRFKDEVGLDYAYFNQLVPYPGTELGEWALKNTTILVENVTDASHFGKKEQVFMETPEFPKADREKIFRILATDYKEGELSNDEFTRIFAGRKNLKALFIRSGRMDPYEHVRSLLPACAKLDALVPYGYQVSDPNLNAVLNYPSPGLMHVKGLRRLVKTLQKAYDAVLYLNTFQSGMSFDNVVAIARHCGTRIFEYQAGEQLREIMPEVTKIYSKSEGSASVRAAAVS
ncbi:MAG: radical SAM protein [Acidobacteria bacterium]|nr:radical SAM protein [Acidobacteriota bacterium]